MKMILLVLSALCFSTVAFAAEMVSPSDGLKRLMDGNQRFREGESKHYTYDGATRDKVNEKHEPFAIVLSCADARTSPNILFDQPLGSLFVVREAGNIAGKTQTESIAFAARNFGVPLVVVMGHQNCAMVQAILLEKIKDPEISELTKHVQPAIDSVAGAPGDPVENAIVANVKLSIQHLLENPDIAGMVRNNQLKVLGGYYDMQSGEVKIFP